MRLLLSFLLFAAMAILAPEFLDAQTSTPTTRPTTSRPTTKPTNKPPTRKPTERKPGIYGDFGPKEYAPQETQQIIVGILIILLLVLMAFEISTPEILFLIALIIVILAEILTLSEGLAGIFIHFNHSLCLQMIDYEIHHRIFQYCINHDRNIILGDRSSREISCR